MSFLIKRFKIQIIFLITLLIELQSTQADLPADIPKCQGGDVKCIANSFSQTIRTYSKGYAPLGLQNIEKIGLKDFVISESSKDRPVSLNLRFDTGEFQGIQNINITKVVGFEKDYTKSKFEVYAESPSIKLDGIYKIGGKVLLLPITGQGPAKIEIVHPKLAIKLKLVNDEVRNGKQYVKIGKVKSMINLDRLIIQLDNLFNGNKELGDSTNKLLNEHWKDIWPELEAGVNNVISTTINTQVSSVLKKFSYDDFYLP